MGHKGPVLRPRCIGPRRARTQILFYSILFHSSNATLAPNERTPNTMVNGSCTWPKIKIWSQWSIKVLTEVELPFQKFMLNQAGRTACSNEAGVYAGSSIATGRVTHTGQVSVGEPDKKCSTMRRQGGLLKHLPISTAEHNLKLKPCPSLWG